jgi:decaprenyl-phosphate phosphoribosyltransferase
VIRALVREARPKQWVKNILVFAAPGAAGVLDDAGQFGRAAVAFVALTAAAAGTYYWNDILDLQADRAHPTKSRRPIASGAIPVGVARVVGTALLVLGIGIGFLVNWQTGLAVVVYVALTVTYSTLWKHIAVLDLVAVAGGFVVRAFAGAYAVDVPVRSWFVLCISFASLLIVTGKRYAELRDMGDDASLTRATLDQYSVGYLRVIVAMSLSATVVSYCLWAFDTMQLTGTSWPFYELSIVPMVAAVMRYVLVLEQGQGGAPEEIFFGDRVLQYLGLAWILVWGCGVYIR